MSIDHEAMIAELERSGLFRVLRRIPRVRESTAPTGEIGRALLVDLETTGTDPKQDALIAVAAPGLFTLAGARPASLRVRKVDGTDLQDR